MCTHNLCFEQKQEKCQNFSTKNFQFFKAKKSLLIAWASFRNAKQKFSELRSSVRLFADDCVLYRNIKSPLDCHILQDDLNSLAKWEMDWQMKFNISKCHSMRVTRQHPSNHIQFSYTLHQQTLEQVQSAKYLGLTITDNLDWGQHIHCHVRDIV